MKCPWRAKIYVTKDVARDTHKSVEWMECYKEECPFYKKDSRKKNPDICLRPYRED